MHSVKNPKFKGGIFVKSYDITVFEFDETVDMEKVPVWFLDGIHSVPPWTPMMAWSWVHNCGHGLQWGAEKLQLPTSKGWDWRLKDGCGYLAILTVEDEAEISRREEHFRKEIIPFLEDYDKVWQTYVDEMLGHYERLKSFDVDKATRIEILEHFEDALRVHKRMWELHFYLMYLVFGVYILFESICKEMLDIDDTKPEFQKLMRGFDNKIFQVDKELWQFSRQAAELGLADILLNSQPNEYLAQIKAHPNGGKFLEEFQAFLQENGWRANRMSELINPTWVEDPSLALVNVKQFLLRGGNYNLDQEREVLAREREEIEKQILAKVPEEQRDWFTAIMRLAQKSSQFSEEHNHYFDLWAHAMLRRALMAVSKRLVDAGVITEVNDIFFLIPDEVRKVTLNPEWHDMKPVVARRRADWESWCQKEIPPMLARITTEEAMEFMIKAKDPCVLKVGVGAFPVPKPELKADMYGVSGSPGVAEGIARVVMCDEDLADVKSGDILVAPATYSSWTPVFHQLKGVVVDRGASLSHTAIVGREHGIPVVMNVFTATRDIKTGQRIRVDGDLGVVYFLDK
jgi:phosphohistidine swiveling domain-containing protein